MASGAFAAVDGIVSYLPGWLQTFPGVDLMRASALLFDAIGEAVYAERLFDTSFPPVGKTKYVAQDRGIIQGWLEPDTDYMVRAARWAQTLRQAGRTRTFMNQTALLFNEPRPRLRLVHEYGWDTPLGRSARWTTRESDGTFTEHRKTPSNFDWDGQLLPDRAFLIFYPPTVPGIEDTLVWGQDNLNWGASTNSFGSSTAYTSLTWGSTATDEIVQRLWLTAGRWKKASVHLKHIIIAFDPASFDPTDPAGSPGLPNGDWAEYGKVDSLGNYAPVRLDSALYFSEQ